MRLFLHGVILGLDSHSTTKALDASDWGLLMPMDNAKPCATCKSRHRVFNTRGKAFCRRCSREDPRCDRATFTTLR